MTTSHVHYAMLDVSGCCAELWLNGFPLLRAGPGAPTNASLPVEDYLVAGTNTLEVLVEPGKRPSRARRPQRELERADARASAYLGRFPAGVIVEVANGVRLGEITWQADETGKSLFPLSRATQVELGAMHGRWSWQDASELVLGPELVAEAELNLKAIRDAICAGDLSGFNRLMSVVADEGVRAYPAFTAQMTADDHAAFVRYYHQQPEPMLPLEPEQYDFRLIAADRVLECVNRDGSTSLKLREPRLGSVLGYPVRLARIDGELRRIR